MRESLKTCPAKVLLGTDPVPFPAAARGRIARDGTRAPDRQRYRWTCSVCDRKDAWFDTWQSYTSYVLDEYGEVLFVTCSEACRESDRGKLLVALADTIETPRWNSHRSQVGDRRIAKARLELGL